MYVCAMYSTLTLYIPYIYPNPIPSIPKKTLALDFPCFTLDRPTYTYIGT
jgi:hypothetical protein